MAALAVIVHEMLGCSHYTAFFQGLHIGRSKTGIQQHVLSVAFLATAPTLVPCYVDNRRIDLPHTYSTQLLGNHLAFPVIQVVVKGGRHGYALRETGGIPPLGTVQGLAVLQHGNAPPAGFHRFLRIFVDTFGHGFGIIGQPAVRQEMAYIPDMSFCVVAFFIEFIHEQELRAYLRHFLLNAHARKKVFHAPFHRKLRVRVTGFSRTGPQEGRKQRKDTESSHIQYVI